MCKKKILRSFLTPKWKKKMARTQEQADSCHFNAVCAMFAAQVAFTLITMIFSMTMIYEAKDSQTTSIFLPMLTSIVAVWLPSPSVPRKRITTTSPPSPARLQEIDRGHSGGETSSASI